MIKIPKRAIIVLPNASDAQLESLAKANDSKELLIYVNQIEVYELPEVK